jgi:nucleoside-diphosphate-sugar epimerase
MEILLTGARGFCGRHLLNALQATSHTVHALARDWSGGESAGNLKLIEADLSAAPELPARFDAVIHTAAKLSTGPTTPADFQKHNTDATKRLIEAAITVGASRFIFFSAMSIYGKVAVDKVSEDTSPVDPDAYSLSKLESETVLAEVAAELPSASLRLPSVLGPGTENGWLTGVIGKLRRGEPVNFVNPDTPFNNAIHIDDLCALLLSLLDRPMSGATVANLGLTETLPVGELLTALKTTLGSNSELTGIANPDAPGFQIDCGRAVQELNWSPMSPQTLISRLGASS